MVRLIFYALLFILLARALNRLWGGFKEGLGVRASGGPQVPQRGVQMVRDPVCGMFVVPSSALRIGDGRSSVYFCSQECRDKYRQTA
jgi:YHS domain-containing protein